MDEWTAIAEVNQIIVADTLLIELQTLNRFNQKRVNQLARKYGCRISIRIEAET